jgi:hypothetical protein
VNTDIRISTSFLNHRKRKKLRQILGDRSDGYLIDLWINTAINRPKGILYDMDKADIALDAGWDGRAGLFVDSLVEVGFLDFDGEWFKLHDWGKHQSWAVNAEERSEQARKAALTRWQSNQDADSRKAGQCSEDADSIRTAQDDDAVSNPPILSSPIQTNNTADAEPSVTFQALKYLTDLGVEKQIAQDFLKVRKTKRQANTETAFNTIKSQIEKSGKSSNDCIKQCVKKSWAGFNCTWPWDGDESKAEQDKKCAPTCFSFQSCKGTGRLKQGEKCGGYCSADNAGR